jgi:hypothetical protein
MNEFEKILDASRDFFSSPEEEREVIDLIRRDPDAILSGNQKPFMKKLASAIIHGRTVGVKEMLDQEARFQTALEKFRSDTFSCFDELRGSINYVKRMLSDRDAHIQRLERDISGAHDKLKEEIAEQFTSVHQLLKKQSQSISEIEDRVFSESEDDEPVPTIKMKWEEAYAKYPDPCDTSIPLELVQQAANWGIADAQYYLYFMLGQQCIFDRFWHIKVSWLEKAANQGHIEAIKRMELEFLPIDEACSKKKAIYFKYKLVEKGELPEVEFLSYALTKGHNVNTSYKIQNPRIACASSAHQVEMCFVIKRRLKTLMKTHYADGSFGHEKCIKLLETLKGTLLGFVRAIPGIMAEFEAI